MWHIIGAKSACTKDRPNDVIKGIMPERFAYLRSDLQDIVIVLRSGWEEKQFKTKPVELGSDETIGDDSDHQLCAQEGQFFEPKPKCSMVFNIPSIHFMLLFYLLHHQEHTNTVYKLSDTSYHIAA